MSGSNKTIRAHAHTHTRGARSPSLLPNKLVIYAECEKKRKKAANKNLFRKSLYDLSNGSFSIEMLIGFCGNTIYNVGSTCKHF